MHFSIIIKKFYKLAQFQNATRLHKPEQNLPPRIMFVNACTKCCNDIYVS